MHSPHEPGVFRAPIPPPPSRPATVRRRSWVPVAVIVAVVAAVVAAVVVLQQGGDGGGRVVSSAPEFDTVRDLADGIAQAGLGCEDVSVHTADEQKIGTAGSGTCTISGQGATLDLFASDGQQNQAFDLAESAGCALGGQLGITEMHLVAGNRWSIALDMDLGAEPDTALLDRVAGALDARHEVIDC